MIVSAVAVIFLSTGVLSDYANYQEKIGCNDDYKPENCASPSVASMVTVEDFERCALGMLAKPRRNFYWATSGRGQTYQANFDGFTRISIIPRTLRNVSRPDLTSNVLGEKVAFPIGLAPLPAQKLASSSGEVASVSAALKLGVVAIVSSLSTTSIEEIKQTMESTSLPETHKAMLWMHTYLFKNRAETMRIANLAKSAGFGAIVVDVGGSNEARINCQNNPPVDSRILRYPLFGNEGFDPAQVDSAIRFEDIANLKRDIKMKIVVMGITNGEDAIRSIRAGASAVIVSNGGGRQLDGAPATIDVLPNIVRALRQRHPRAEVYMDGGVRNGYDVFKALARGAKAVFIGRPIAYGLTIGGEEGVTKILTTMQRELNETMLLTSTPRIRGISPQSIVPQRTAPFL